jgi:hypothetical protein
LFYQISLLEIDREMQVMVNAYNKTSYLGVTGPSCQILCVG